MNANTEPNTAPKVINGRINGRFAPGYSGNPGGSPDRARKALNAETIEELHKAFRRGGAKAIDKVMKNNPAVFLKLLVQHELELSDGGAARRRNHAAHVPKHTGGMLPPTSSRGYPCRHGRKDFRVSA